MINEKSDDQLPLGPDWGLRLRVSGDGRRSYRYGPPTIVARFWAWPVGLAIVAAMGSLPTLPPPIAFFGAGAVLVAFWNELRWSTARENHATLLHEVHRLRDDLEQQAR